MKIHFNPKDFSTKFRLAASVAVNQYANPILQNVKAQADKKGGVVLHATDGEIGIRIRLDCDVIRNGEAIFPKERLLKVLDLTREELLILEYVEDKIVINGEDKEHYELDTMLADEFPALDEFGETAYHEVPAKALKEVIQRTIFATDTENVRYALGGISFEMVGQVISIVATDGRRLAWQDCGGVCINNHNVEMAIVPVRALQLLNRALGDKSIGEDTDVKMAVGKDRVLFQCQDITLFSRLVEGRFPKWRNIIPKTEDMTAVTIDCDPLLSAILQAQVTTNEQDPGIDFSFEKGKLTLQGQGKERGNTKIEIPLSFNEAPKKVKIDPKFMTDFLKVLEANRKVSIYLPAEAGEPIKITADDGGYVYVLMPLSS
jgi:DNA polymerase-3 subunit beta